MHTLELPCVAHIVADLDELDELDDPTLLRRTRSALPLGRRSCSSGGLLSALPRAIRRAASAIAKLVS